jgi:uncharacterized YigZ family protein
MNKPLEIRVIDKNYEAELKEKTSRFIGFAFPVENEEEILSYLKDLKKKYYDATHHCYAYKTLSNEKYSDAGEPSGTAGIRIYNAIEHFHLTNILVVVVRYFGGTKLGVGGLGKAYYETAFAVLEKAGKTDKKLYQKVFIKVDFEQVKKIYHVFNESENKIVNTNYTDKVEFECLVKSDDHQHIISTLIDLTNGKVEITLAGILYF